MITITSISQRIFFTPNRNVEIENACEPSPWLLNCGTWADAGVWGDEYVWSDTPQFGLFAVKGVVLTNVGTVKAEMPLNVTVTSRSVSIGLDLFVGLPDEDYIFNVEYINDIAPVVIDYYERVEADGGQNKQDIINFTARLMKLAKIDTIEKNIYSTRLKIKRQKVTRKSNAQSVTRKVNRIAI